MSEFYDSERLDSRDYRYGINIKAASSPKGGTRLRLPPFPSFVRPEQSKKASDMGFFAPLFTRKRQASKLFEGQAKQLSSFARQQTTAPKPSSREVAYTSANPPAVKPKRKRVNTERRREQCHRNQAHYRDRQRRFIRELQDRVIQRREEVRELSMERHALCYGAQTKCNVWNVVIEYFRLFRYGYFVPASDTGSAATTTSFEPSFQEQECFLRAAMSPDVAVGELIGVDALLEQWQRYSTYFSGLHFHLERMEE